MWSGMGTMARMGTLHSVGTMGSRVGDHGVRDRNDAWGGAQVAQNRGRP